MWQIQLGGWFNLLLCLFHLGFWKIWDWPASLAGISGNQKAIMQVMNLHLSIALLLFAYVSIVHSQAMVSTSLGKVVLGFIAAFYLIRAINQLLFWQWDHPKSIGIAVVCVLVSLLYFIPLVPKN